MNCLLEFRKMTFMIHLIFTFLTGIIFRPLFDEITIHGNVKITFFMKSTWYRRWCLMNFFSSLHFSRIHCNFMLITFLNGLPHSKHFSRCLFNLLLVITNSRIHCNFVFIPFLNGLWHSPQFHLPSFIEHF